LNGLRCFKCGVKKVRAAGCKTIKSSTLCWLQVIVLALLPILRLYAFQPVPQVFHHLGLSDGLAQSSVQWFFQDRDGFYWMGTAGGVQRFDGQTWVSYALTPQASTFSFAPGGCQDAQGNIYFSSRRALWVYRPEMDVIQHFATPLSGSFLEIKGCVLDRWIWVTEGHYLHYLVDLYTGEVLATSRFQGLGENVCGALATDGAYWLLGSLGMARFDPFGRQWFYYPHQDMKLRPEERIWKVHSKGKKHWLITSFRLLWLQDTLVKEVYSDPEGGMVGGGVVEDVLYVGARGHGILRFKDTIALSILPPHPHVPKLGPINTECQLAYQDAEGGIWLACDGYGLSYFQPRFALPGLFMGERADGSGFVTSIIPGENGKWHVGNLAGEVWEISGKKWPRLIHTFGPNQVLRGGMAENTQRWLWCTSRGLVQWDEASRKATLLTNGFTSGALSSHPYRSCICIKNKHWGTLVMMENLLLQNREDVWKTVHVFEDNMAQGLYVDRQSRIWVGSKAGHGLRIFAAPDSCKLWSQMLEGENIYAILEDTLRSWIWAAGSRGLWVFQQNQWRLWPLGAVEPHQVRYGVLPGTFGQIWTSGNDGLVCLDVSTGFFRRWTELDGIQSNEFNMNAFGRNKAGEMAWGGISGFHIFKPGVWDGTPKSAKLYASFLRLNDTGLVRYPVSGLSIGPGVDVVGVGWGRLAVFSGEKVRYRIRLEGVDAGWVEREAVGEVRYSRLSPGQYTCWIQANVEGGPWSKPMVLLHFKILPYWWQTLGARLAGLTLMLGLLLLAFRRVVTFRLKQRIARLEKENALEKERNRIARDLHDELGSSLFRMVYLGERIKGAEPLVVLARDATQQLNGLVWGMHPETETLGRFMEFAQKMLEKMVSGTEVSCVVSVSLGKASEFVLSPEWRKQHYFVFRELATNAIKHSGGTLLGLTFQVSGDEGFWCFWDNGKGLNSSSVGVGTGLDNIRRRMEEVGVRLEWQEVDAGTRVLGYFHFNASNRKDE
jgi:hypothetical protein